MANTVKVTLIKSTMAVWPIIKPASRVSACVASIIPSKFWILRKTAAWSTRLITFSVWRV